MPSASTTRRIVALNRDLFFGVRLKQLGASLGYSVDLVPDAARFVERLRGEDVALGIIDINAGPDWGVIAGETGVAGKPPILAFGPHMDVDGLRAAKAAGVTRVVSNGQFHRDPVGLIARYAGGSDARGTDEEDEIHGD